MPTNQSRDFDTLAPEFRVRVDGRELPVAAAADLRAVSVVDDVDALGMFTFTLFCWDSAEMKVKWLDDDLFEEGNAIEIKMGYRDNLETLFKGEITGLEPDFPSGEPPTLTVRGYDRRHRLMRKRKTRTFLSMKDSDIAAQIAGDAGFSPDVDNTGVTLDYVLQHNQTDWEFLKARAQRIGYEVVIDDRTLLYRPRQNAGSGAVTLKREIDLLDFNVRLSTMEQVEEVIVQGWDAKKKEEVISRSTTGEERPMGGSASGPVTVRDAFGQTGSVAVDMPVQSQAEADKLAGGWFSEMALRYVVGEGVCIGRPDLRPGCLVEIEGIGRRFSGSYYVTSTEHAYTTSSGYRTSFSVKRNAT